MVAYFRSGTPPRFPFLKVGQAYLDGGEWRGRRIVDASWVKLSTAPRVSINPATTGLDPQKFPEFYGEGVDAWAWHLSELHSGDRTYRETTRRPATAVSF